MGNNITPSVSKEHFIAVDDGYTSQSGVSAIFIRDILRQTKAPKSQQCHRDARRHLKGINLRESVQRCVILCPSFVNICAGAGTRQEG